MSQPAAELNPKGYAAPVVQMIPLASIHESKSNPRKTFSGIEQLAEDVKVRGLLQPVLVRAGTNGHAGDYELVFGARRFRAAKLAKLPAIPAFVRELTDEQTLELQIVENTQRADVHPLEEADGYRRLHEEFKYSVEEIAAKVGKSRSAVYERIKLCALVPAAREAFFAEKLSASTALLVARIPDKELQGKAVKDLVGRAGDDPMSYRDAVDHVQRNYMLQLKDAPFSTTDATLVAKAGACAACPKRTGNQRELFADVKSPDVCTDPSCYRGKVDALWNLKVEKAKESGQEVLDEKKSKELFKYGGLDYSAGLKELDTEEWVGNKRKTVRQIVGKDAPTVLARDPATGKIRELVRREVVNKALRQAAPNVKARADNEKMQEKFHREQELRDATAAALLREVVAKLEARDVGKTAWFILAEAVMEDEFEWGRGEENADFVVARLGHPPRDDYEKDIADLRTLLAKMGREQLVGFVFELILRHGDTFHKLVRGEKGPINELARVLGVDEKKVAAQTKKAVAEKDKRLAAEEAGPSKSEQIADAVKKIKKLAAPKKAVRGTTAKADRVKSSKVKSSKAKPGKKK